MKGEGAAPKGSPPDTPMFDQMQDLCVQMDIALEHGERLLRQDTFFSHSSAADYLKELKGLYQFLVGENHGDNPEVRSRHAKMLDFQTRVLDALRKDVEEARAELDRRHRVLGYAL